MMTPALEMLVDSWRRNAAIVEALAKAVQPEDLHLKVAEGEMSVCEHLCHIHGVRRGWIHSIDPSRLEGTLRLHEQHGDDWLPVCDILAIRARLPESAGLVEILFSDLIAATDGKAGPYDNPVMFLQHMLWHDGWHVGSILAALRVNGRELPEEWEEPNVWTRWRGPEEG